MPSRYSNDLKTLRTKYKMYQLTSQQEALLEQALLDAFPTKDELSRMLQYRLGKNLESIAMGDNLSIIVFKLIQFAKANGWIFDLIARAREANPRNPNIVSFCQKIDLSPHGPEEDTFERIISQKIPFLDVNVWRQKLGALENQVCRVEVPLSNGRTAFGTGFLVSPNLLLTNYHVVEYVINREPLKESGKTWANPEDVICRFDYKVLFGNVLNPGMEYHLTADWLVDWSPMSNWDRIIPPKGGYPNSDELDFALLRLQGNPGNQPVGENPEPGAQKRSWIFLTDKEFSFPKDATLLILQHPKGVPLKLALDTNSNLSLNDNKTRVTYRTNTEHGSSGSPCFTLDWELIAIHHAGDPDYSITHHPDYNQGIPIRAILDFLELRGTKQMLIN